MRAFNVDWNFALEKLKSGYIATRSYSTWKGYQGRMTDDGRFQKRHYIEGIFEDCEPHWTEWEDSDWNTYPANINATDWAVTEGSNA